MTAVAEHCIKDLVKTDVTQSDLFDDTHVTSLNRCLACAALFLLLTLRKLSEQNNASALVFGDLIAYSTVPSLCMNRNGAVTPKCS